LEQVLAGIDDGFDSIVNAAGVARAERRPAQAEPGLAQVAPDTTDELAEPRQLFEQIAATYMRPVRDFMVELQMGEPPKDWLRLCLPAMTSLGKSARSMGLGELCAAIDEFVAVLRQVESSREQFIGGASRDALVAAYAGLSQQMPGAFALDEERDRREPIIVQSLLAQVKGVRTLALDKIYSAGLSSLAMFYAAKPEDIVAATGLPLDLSARIVQRFARYKAETADVAPDPERSGEQAELSDLVTTLKKQNDDFHTASDQGSTTEKRRLRGKRTNTMLKVSVLLARLGEVDRLRKLERLPFDHKVEQLEQIVQELKNRHAAPA
jgi:hypothetical protein